jgi:hypothetical protein
MLFLTCHRQNPTIILHVQKTTYQTAYDIICLPYYESGPGSKESIATRYRLDSPAIESW